MEESLSTLSFSTVKGQDTKAAAKLIEPVVGPETAIISFQNGVEWLDILSDHFSPDNMIPGTTMTPAAIEKTRVSFVMSVQRGRSRLVNGTVKSQTGCTTLQTCANGPGLMSH